MSIQYALAAANMASGFMDYKQNAADVRQSQIANREADMRDREYLLEDYDQIGKARLTERQAAAEEVEGAAVAGMKARATARVSAGEAGVGGMSVEALLRDIYGQEAKIRNGVNQNLDNTESELDMQMRGAQRNTINRMASRTRYAAPNKLAAALKIGTAGAAGFSAGGGKFPGT